MLACDMNVNGSDVSYLIPVAENELSGGTADLSRSHEVYGNAYIEGYKDWLFHLPVWKEPAVYRYARRDDGALAKDGSLQLSNNAGAGLCNLIFLYVTCRASYGYTPAEYGQKCGFLRIKNDWVISTSG